jgi:hypothetical protein
MFDVDGPLREQLSRRIMAGLQTLRVGHVERAVHRRRWLAGPQRGRDEATIRR